MVDDLVNVMSTKVTQGFKARKVQLAIVVQSGGVQKDCDGAQSRLS